MRYSSEIKPEKVERARFSPESIRKLREKLGLSRQQMAGLLAASNNSVFLWESGKAAPQAKSKIKLLELRHTGVREIRKRLEELNLAKPRKRKAKAAKTVAPKVVAAPVAAPASAAPAKQAAAPKKERKPRVKKAAPVQDAGNKDSAPQA